MFQMVVLLGVKTNVLGSVVMSYVTVASLADEI